MSPVTHFLIGWVVANGEAESCHKRAIVAIAGVMPDVDGLGLIIDYALQDKSYPLWSQFHHVLAHNLCFALLVSALSFMLSGWCWKIALLSGISFHLHLLGDLVGSRGPDGYQWPIPYLYPLISKWIWSWEKQWELNAWPNFVVTGVALMMTFYLAWKRGYSPLEMISVRADGEFVRTLRRRYSQS